ncbi:MAG: hypothetical protein HY246_20710 [Proteobacteria bacterium]|nr:hypothetical protein [Pseudomonadota bacterium]
MAQDVVGSVSWPVFFFGTIVIFGWAGFATAEALARTWRPWWQCLQYGVLLGIGNRAFELLLFEGSPLSVPGIVVDTAWIFLVMAMAYRVTRARMMVSQYPWLYERTGLFGWREKGRA